jgi:hypothetical protein
LIPADIISDKNKETKENEDFRTKNQSKTKVEQTKNVKAMTDNCRILYHQDFTECFKLFIFNFGKVVDSASAHFQTAFLARRIVRVNNSAAKSAFNVAFFFG